MVNNKDKQKTLSSLLDELVDVDLENNKYAIDGLLGSFWEYYKSQGRHSYHEVTEYILRNMTREKEGEAIPVIAGNLSKLLDVLKKECNCTDEITYYDCKRYIVPFSCEQEHDVEGGLYNCYDYKQLYRFLFKLYDHVQLEFIRWSDVKKETSKLSTLNKQLKSQLQETKEQQDNIEASQQDTFSKIYEVQEQTKSIYMQMISILGIFAAIVIAVFGGLNVINSISSAFLQGDITIHRTILVVSLCTLFVIWVIFTLLGMTRWFRFQASPTWYSIMIFFVITAICVIGIVWALKQGYAGVTS